MVWSFGRKRKASKKELERKVSELDSRLNSQSSQIAKSIDEEFSGRRK